MHFNSESLTLLSSFTQMSSYPHSSVLRTKFKSFTFKTSLHKHTTKTRTPPLLSFLNTSGNCFQSSQRHKSQVVEAVRYNGPIMDVDEESEFVVESCVTITLEPALTLKHGLQGIKEAIQELKLNPPQSPCGILRIQVAVPPVPRALDWFCCQPESSQIYPLFYLSKETEKPSYKALHMHRTPGVFGIGAAVYLTHHSPCTGEQRLTQRYMSDDTNSITIYGFLDFDFTTEESSIEQKNGSYYLFIPQLELVEYEDISILAATLAWNDSRSSTLEEVIHSCESSIYQVSGYFCIPTETYYTSCLRSTLRKLNVLENKTIQMAYLNDLLLISGEFGADYRKLREAPSSSLFCARLSPTTVLVSNMMDHATSEDRVSIPDLPNINSVWAWLLVEECCRLGLTYFCIAPGSRSSPLAIAASTHPLTTCIACYDERSLAFHALGYARGSHKPAVVITTSGTAVSNLLPAVVEANQDFVPLLLLTADRPPELRDTGANQAINQVNHFGVHVRFFFSLPTPTDQVYARMVLTTLDSAMYLAMSLPFGPVHINCPFREPLDTHPSTWMSSCLKGLDIWMSSSEPFTEYINVQQHGCNDTHRQVVNILDVIQKANKGLLLIGALHTEDEIWASILLAKHLSWPVVADILSGLRLRKLLTSFPEIQEKISFIDHLDHALLSGSVRKWVQSDVIIQIGSRITSKRISQMLEECFPCAYILVDKHPFRHDPSHIVTHRIQSNIVQFADILLKAQFPPQNHKWTGYLQLLNMMVARETTFQICVERSLTEPHIAHIISDALSSEYALFAGNSMAIRDVDMYGCGWADYGFSTSDLFLNTKQSFLPIRVAGNRGASGIDGLLSTAVGFAVGCNKRVFCIIGDISLLHDTNSLAILNQRTLRKPMTVLVINNHGGSIFSLLPVANRTERRVLDQYFYTSHNISIQKLCEAHGVKHDLVCTKTELQDALSASPYEEMDRIIEVDSSIDANAVFHSTLRKLSCQVADHTLYLLSKLSASTSTLHTLSLGKIHKVEYSLYRIPLCAPPTSKYVDYEGSDFYKEGFLISILLEDESTGFGEVAPLNIDKENLLDVEDQLRFLLHVLKGVEIKYCLSLLNDSFNSFLWNDLGIPVNSIYPSVRCGLEMAILNAISSRLDANLLSILQPNAEGGTSGVASCVRICALLDSDGTPKEVADVASALVGQGFSAIKLKVARRANPIEDAAVIQEVRKRVGQEIELRVDANRKWTYKEAMQFSLLVKNVDLQYIEEPVDNEDDILTFCEESGLPVALDETIDNIQEDFLEGLVQYTYPGIVAVVIKPSLLGGFENSKVIAKWAQQQGKMAVVSAAFESSLALSAYVLFASYLANQNEGVSAIMGRELTPPIAHGLGTYQWIKEDITTESLAIRHNPESGTLEASIADASQVMQNFKISNNTITRKFSEENVRSYQLPVDSANFSCFFKVQELGQRFNDTAVIFLHGFLGTNEEWIPIMKALSGSARCISIDLPGHGGSMIRAPVFKTVEQELSFSLEIVADMVCKLIHHITPGKVTLVGYSMGARIALYMALRFSNKIDGAVIISGSPGLKDSVAKKIREAKDDSRASFLVVHGLKLFLDNWYSGALWESLRTHPHFNRIVSSRMQHDDLQSLAKSLSALSIGRQPSLWEELKQCKTPLLLIVGEKDEKFKGIAGKMWSELCHSTACRDDLGNIMHEVVEIPNAGHSAHLENPLLVIRALRKYLNILRKGSVPA